MPDGRVAYTAMRKEIIIFGFITGIAIRSFVDMGVSFALLIFSLSIFLFLSEYFYRTFLNKEVKLKNIALVLFAISFGMFWYDFRELKTDNILEENVGKTVSLSVVVDEEPEEKEGITNLIASFGDSKILVKTNNFPKYEYGDKIDVFGELKKPENFSADFDYEAYLAKDGIFYLMDKPKISLASRGNGDFVSAKLFEIKNIFVESIKTAFYEPQSSLLSGLVFGAKDSLGKEWLDKFRIAGLSHIIVLSGYNLTIIADATMAVISKIFSRSISILLGSISIILFAIMTGGGASTVRATIMALIILLAKATGRMYEASSALVLAGFFMIVYNPRVLVFDMSFQLSFLATMGLIYISPKLKEKMTFLTEKFQLRELVATTLGAQFATAPLIAYKMGTFSLVSLPANLLVVVLISATMFFGFFAAVFNLLNFYLALPFVAIAWLLLSYELSVVDIFSSLPFASVGVNFSIVAVVVLLIIFIIGYLKYRKENEPLRGWEIEEIS